MAIIRLHDAWARYCRELVILSACGNSVTLTGAVVPAVIRRRSDVIPALLGNLHQKKAVRAQMGKRHGMHRRGWTSQYLKSGTMAAALGATNSPAEEIRNVRNYYAHRGEGAASAGLGL
jgi:hypothetical protein